MRSLSIGQVQKVSIAELKDTPFLVTAYGKPVACVVSIDHVDESGLLKPDAALETNINGGCLTKDQKRALLKEFIHSPGVSHQAKAKYMELDSRLAGDFAPDRQEITTFDGDRGAEDIKELARLQHEAREEAERIVSKVSTKHHQETSGHTQEPDNSGESEIDP